MPNWVIHSKEASLIIVNVCSLEIRGTGSLRSTLLGLLRLLREEKEAPLQEDN